MRGRRLPRTRFLALGLLLLSPLARGHGPAQLDEGPLVVPDPELSWVYVSEFITGDEVFEIILEYPDEGFALPVELLVPHRRDLKNHRPMFAVVGPGLPPPTDADRALLPRELPEGVGVFIDKNDDAEREVIFEGVLRRTYWTSRPTALAVDAGRSEIWVWSPDGTTGDFSIGLGVEEDFGPDSVNDLLANWSLYAY